MSNKKIIAISVGIILAVFFLTSFAGGTDEKASIAVRNVVFTDSYDGHNIADYEVELGKASIIPDIPVHKGYIFKGWYDYNNQSLKIENFDRIVDDIHVVAVYASDINDNNIPDDEEVYYEVKFIDTIDKKILKTEKVLEGMAATAPLNVEYDNYEFAGWDKSYSNVTSDLQVRTIYNKKIVNNDNLNNQASNTYLVTFVDGDDGKTIKTVEVREGVNATLPTPIKHLGRVFDYWDGNYKNVRSNQKVVARYADDKNNNGKKDSLDTHYVIEFVSNGRGTLDGKTRFTNSLVGMNFDSVGIIVPKTVAEQYYKFDRWDPPINKVVNNNVKYKALFVPENDINNNEIADETERHYTVEFKVNENGSLKGTSKYEHVLYGLTFEEAGIVIPTPVADQYYKFVGWDKEFSEIVISRQTYYAKFEPINDKNNNGIADETESHYTIEFRSGEHGSIRGRTIYETLMLGMQFKHAGIVVATPVSDENYVFDRWDPPINTTITGSAIYTALFVPVNN